MNVKAGNGNVVPSQTNRLGRQSIRGSNCAAKCERTQEFTPSAATTRSAPLQTDSSVTSVEKANVTPRLRARRCRMLSSFAGREPEKPWPRRGQDLAPVVDRVDRVPVGKRLR